MRPLTLIFGRTNRLRRRGAAALVMGAVVSCSLVVPNASRAADIGALDASVQEIIEIGKQGCAADLDTYCSNVTPGEGRLAFCLIANADKRTFACEAALARARTAAEQLIDDAKKSEDACVADIARLCAGTQPGEGRIAQCLADNRPELGEKCAEVVDVVGKVIFAARDVSPAEPDFVTSAANIVAPPAAPEPPGSTAPPAEAAAPPAAPEPPAAAAPPPSPTPIADALMPKVQAILEKGKIGCQADLDTYCSTVTPGEGRLAFCLIAHADKRSPACERAIDDARGEVEMLINNVSLAIEACLPDMKSLCGGTEPGGGRIAQCLADNRAALSIPCGQVIDIVGPAIFPPSNQGADATPTLPAFVGPNSTGALPDTKSEAAAPSCRWLEASVSDWGKDATRRDARRKLSSRASAFAASKGLKGYKAADVSVNCATNMELGVTANYTCRARTQVCWDEAAAAAAPGTPAPANKP